jgi:hypothetical protein
VLFFYFFYPVSKAFKPSAKNLQGLFRLADALVALATTKTAVVEFGVADTP